MLLHTCRELPSTSRTLRWRGWQLNLWAGTSLRTKDPAATIAPLPTTIFPRIVAPAPINTPSWIFGCRSPAAFPVPPSVTPCNRIQVSVWAYFWHSTRPQPQQFLFLIMYVPHCPKTCCGPPTHFVTEREGYEVKTKECRIVRMATWEISSHELTTCQYFSWLKSMWTEIKRWDLLIIIRWETIPNQMSRDHQSKLQEEQQISTT